MKAQPWLLAASEELDVGRVLNLDPGEARHAAGPLRRRVGDSVILVDGSGRLAEAVLRGVGSRKVEAEVLSVRVEPPPVGEGVTLALGVLGSQAMDWAVQKAVEVGVRHLLPMISERTQAGRRTAADRSPHWNRIALQALKQCKRAWAMEVAEPLPLAEVIETYGAGGGGVVAAREGVSVGRLPANVGRLLVVGPEGGFGSAEDRLLADLDWPRLRLGAHVLRAETAAVVGAALLVARDEGL